MTAPKLRVGDWVHTLGVVEGRVVRIDGAVAHVQCAGMQSLSAACYVKVLRRPVQVGDALVDADGGRFTATEQTVAFLRNPPPWFESCIHSDGTVIDVPAEPAEQAPEPTYAQAIQDLQNYSVAPNTSAQDHTALTYATLHLKERLVERRAEQSPVPDAADGWDDRKLKPEEEKAIHEAHPTRSGRHDLYAEAMRLVGSKRSKVALVKLVNWLLHRAEQPPAPSAEALARENEMLRAALEQIRDHEEKRPEDMQSMHTLFVADAALGEKAPVPAITVEALARALWETEPDVIEFLQDFGVTADTAWEGLHPSGSRRRAEDRAAAVIAKLGGAR